MADEKDNKRGAALRKAYGEANTALREAHREEFEALYVEKAKANGVTYTPKPSKAEKDRAALAKLLADNPDLKQELFAEVQKSAATQA